MAAPSLTLSGQTGGTTPSKPSAPAPLAPMSTTAHPSAALARSRQPRKKHRTVNAGFGARTASVRRDQYRSDHDGDFKWDDGFRRSSSRKFGALSETRLS